MANNDRVSELYHGAILTAESQRVCRERIHWMCKQIRGETVLDIGCSQGIATILAAREGHRVVGVEIEEPAIRYAEQQLAEEHAHVGERVQLIHGDIFSVNLDIERFDTVLLGEVVEHQTNPRRLMERACELLAPAGVVVVTTPFGLHVHDDHKSTLYLSDFVGVVDGLCSPHALAIVDGYIRFTGRHLDTEGTLPAWRDLLTVSEAAFIGKERSSYETLADRSRRIKELSKKSENLSKKSEEWRTRTKNLERKVTALEAKLQRDRALIEDLTGARKELERQLAAEKKKLSEALRTKNEANNPTGNKRRNQSTESSSATVRGVSALRGSIRRERESGRLRREPLTAARKTYARVRRAVRKLPPPSDTSKPPALGRPQSKPQSEPARAASSHAPPDAEPDPRLLGVRPPAGDGPLVAGIVGPRLATEISACGRFWQLPPDAWRARLEAERPAFVLVTSGGLAGTTGWGTYGTPGAANGAAMLNELTEACREAGVPMVLWDTHGTLPVQLRRLRGAHFDLVYTVSPRIASSHTHTADPAPQLLPAAVAPRVYHPIGATRATASQAIYAGAFNRRLPRAELDALEALLRAARDHDLAIFDANAGYQGALAEVVRFPEPVRDRCARRPTLAAELRAIRAAGLRVCRSPTANADFVGWDQLRSIALGAHVLSTPFAADSDTAIARHVRCAAEDDVARVALDELAQRPLRDAVWRDAFDRVLAAYTLSERLDAIAAASGTGPVAAAPPLVGVIAATHNAGELDALRRFLDDQIRGTPWLGILAAAEITDADALASVVDGGRVEVARSPAALTASMCEQRELTHYLIWTPSLDNRRSAIAEVAAMAHVSAAEILTVDRDDVCAYAYGAVRDGAAIAMRAESARALTAGGLLADPTAVARTLAAEGARVLASGAFA